MKMCKVLGVALLCVGLLGGGAAAQEQVIIQGPPRDLPQLPGMGPRQAKTGTARIRGRIVASETGAPVRRAQVRISGTDVTPRAAMTDADGRYEFRDLPAGRFSITAQKSGFMTMQYGQTRPFEQGKSIELAEAQAAEKIDVAMPRGSVISGRIVDEFGEPLTDAFVAAMRSTWSNGKRRLQPAGRAAQTNDLGQYRIFGLPPGEYFVSATFRGGETAIMEMAMIASMTTTGGPAGSSPNSGYAATYFPGTTNASDAQRVTLSPGQEAQGTDFALIPVRLARITGTVINSEGKPVEGTMVSALPRSMMTEFAMTPGSSARTDRNGNFTMTNVAPGEYTLQTRGGMMMFTSTEGDRTTFSMTATRVVGPGGTAGPAAEPEYGAVPVSVSGDDVSNVVILTAKGTNASGKVTFEGGTKPDGTGTVRIVAASVDPDMPTVGGPPAAVAADGSFEVKGLAGTRMLRPLGLPQGWVLKAVRVNGDDATDTGIEFKTEPVSGIEIVVTNKMTEVSGSVHDGDGTAVKDYTVVFFSDEPQKWTLPQNRYVVAARPDTEGRYRVRNLPSGGYYAVAMEYIAQGEWGDPELLQRLASKATRVEIGDGETKSLDLKIDR